MADKEAARALADKLMGRAAGGAMDAILGGVRDTGEDRTADDDDTEDQDLGGDDADEDEDADQLDADEADEDGDIDGDETDADDDSDEDDQENDGEDYDEVAYSDDDVIEVTVDGEPVEATLRELKAAYAGEGAIEKRLKEATEARKAANADYTAGMAELETQRTNLLQTLQSLDEVLFSPLIDPPDPKLRTRNMNQYLLEKDAYDEDQKRIASARQELTGKLHAQAQAQAEARGKYRAAQQAELLEKWPELKSPKMAPKLQAEIMEAAAHYGFSPAMIAQVDFHGAFLMARDAARWLNLQKIKNSKNGNSPVGGTGTAKRKKLRSGGIAAIKTAAQKSAKQRQVIAKRAQSSGSAEDVTALILSNARAKNPKGSSGGRRR